MADCIPIKGNSHHYLISCFGGGQFTVDLNKYECTCRAWQLTGIPSTHVICALLKQNLDPVAYVHDCYTIHSYLKAYELPIFGISHDLLWRDSLYIPPLPPNFGRRGTREGDGTGEVSGPIENETQNRVKSRRDGTGERGVDMEPPSATDLGDEVVVAPPRTTIDELVGETIGLEGHFSKTPFVPPQPTSKKIYVDGGQKFMDLSTQTSVANGKGNCWVPSR
ncbi:hypothetical protein ACS0TY_017430 [Phlomoides rotata]